MKKLALGALFAGLAACSGGKNNDVMLVDAPMVDAMTTCNPLTQGGCNPGEKCTWINDQDNPPIGHVGCAPDPGATGIAIGSACTEGPAGPMGYDTCVKGSVCLSGECKQICDQAGGTPTCDQNHSCTRYADFFETGGTAVAGVCDPACDPLTQDLKVGAVTAACGSTMATMPTKGCYGYDDYSCAPAGMSVYTLTDRMAPRTNAAGNPYLNGCAPGFLPFFYEMTGSTVTKCTGYCAALEVDNTTIGGLTPVQREDGDVTAIGKMPTTVKAAGDAICSITKKGSRDSSMCKFIWPYVRDSATGELPAQFAAGPHLDKLGVCQAVEFFKYAKDADMVADDPFPNCRDLPRLTADMMDEDAADWGCQKFSNSMFIGNKAVVNPAISDMRVPKGLALEVVRHNMN
ncbi:MAG: hypothetical protein H0T42_17345 [Deltaproteobacteria bacterium]|nr:hypothetical protein [Deltaproteobacteria bacterium]